jgi:hypothetical protein
MVYLAVSLGDMEIQRIRLVALAVGFQHLCIFVKYQHKVLHILLILGLEIWFQLEAYYVFTFATISVKVGLWCVVISHYIQFVHAIVVSYLESLEAQEQTKSEEIQKNIDTPKFIKWEYAISSFEFNKLDIPLGDEEETPSPKGRDSAFPLESSKSFIFYRQLTNSSQQKSSELTL